MKDFNVEERVTLAVQNFESGYNCAQAVFMAYYDVFDIDFEMAKSMSVSFGGGVGRLREICGTISAGAMLAGFRYPVINKDDQEARTKNYEIVQKIAGLFQEQHASIICRTLLPPEDANQTSPAPSLRTPEYYAKRPCSKYVATSARITGMMLKGELD